MNKETEKKFGQKKTVFEKIIAGEIPCHKIYEDDDTFAFLDINPDSRGHALVMPKIPYENIHGLPTEMAKKLIISVQKVANAVKKVTGASGIKIVMNNGALAGQEIFHAHIHIIPKFQIQDGGGKFSYKDGEAASLAAKILDEL